jgi:hypothetical protein
LGQQAAALGLGAVHNLASLALQVINGIKMKSMLQIWRFLDDRDMWLALQAHTCTTPRALGITSYQAQATPAVLVFTVGSPNDTRRTFRVWCIATKRLGYGHMVCIGKKREQKGFAFGAEGFVKLGWKGLLNWAEGFIEFVIVFKSGILNLLPLRNRVERWFNGSTFVLQYLMHNVTRVATGCKVVSHSVAPALLC